MIVYPEIDPVILSLTPTLQIRWYGLMYLLAFGLGGLLLRYQTRNLPGWEKSERASDLVFYTALGVVLGGRLGYVVFYDFADYLASPLDIFKIWRGGMSFHGGLIGVILSTHLFAKHNQFAFWAVIDKLAPVVPIGLAAGRLGNFINGELWGRVTDVPWAMIFPHAGALPRHPSQLYAVLLEGLLLYLILWRYSAKPRQNGQVAGMFLVSYGVIRSIEEWFRQPDPQYGYLAWEWLTMGQLLCLPMVLIGLYLLRIRKI